MQELIAYWRTTFDWRAQEQAINAFANFRAEIDGVGIHFIHERGKGSNPIPLILTHGWPSSFAEMLKIIPMLTDPFTRRRLVGAPDGRVGVSTFRSSCE